MYIFTSDSREKPKKEKSRSREPEPKLKELKSKDEENKDDTEKEKNQLESETNDIKPESAESLEPKGEKKDDLLSADHKPDAPMDEKAEKATEEGISDVKIEKERDRSPRKSRSKSYDRSRYVRRDGILSMCQLG